MELRLNGAEFGWNSTRSRPDLSAKLTGGISGDVRARAADYRRRATNVIGAFAELTTGSPPTAAFDGCLAATLWGRLHFGCGEIVDHDLCVQAVLDSPLAISEPSGMTALSMAVTVSDSTPAATSAADKCSTTEQK